MFILYDMKSKKVFTTFDIAKLFKISRSNIQQYIDRKLINPSIEETRGKGTKSLFSLDDLYAIRLFQKLHEVGLSQREASQNSCLVDFNKIGKKEANWVKIVRDKSKAKIVHINESSIQAEIHTADMFIAVNLLRIKKEIDALVGKKKDEIAGMKEVAEEARRVRMVRIGKKDVIR